MNRRSKFFLASALFFLAWQGTTVVLWLSQYDSPAEAVRCHLETLRQDWLLLMIVTDLMAIFVLAVSWVIVDLRKRGASFSPCVAWTLLLILFGSSALLVYLARAAPREPAASS